MVTQTDRDKSFLIIYTSGAYGTFLDWCINYFSGIIDNDDLPFQNSGNAHNWRGCATDDVTKIKHETIDWWLSRVPVPLVLRTHNNADMYDQNTFLQKYALRFDRVILLHNHVDCHLLVIQNTLSKIKSLDRHHWLESIENRFRSKFGADTCVPRWQLREMLSYWHEEWHCFMTDLYQPSDHENVININPRNLLSDFEGTLINLFTDLDIAIQRRDKLSSVRDRWLDLQKFKDIDYECHRIVQAVVNNQNLSTAACDNDVLNEAFVLYQLRVHHGLDFACTGMDDFPANTYQLRKYLIPYVDQG